jgi:outer membrane protein OmpA-like peptidoglycan-associated protein
MTMILALVALAMGAVAGLFLATRHFRRKRLPVWGALLHGLGGATGFTLVLLTVVREPSFRPVREALYLLIATVVFGVVNLLFHVRRVRHRTSLIALHALCAVTGVGLLIRAILVYPAPEASPQPAPAARASPAASPARVPASAATPSTPPGHDAGRAATATDTAPPAEHSHRTLAIHEAVRPVLDRPILFERGSATISAESLSAITEIASVLGQHPEIALLEVQGHADERGGDAKNLPLTRARAATVVSALVARGVERERLHSAGYAARCAERAECRSDSPPASCHEPDQWQRDRRVAFVVLRTASGELRGEVVCSAGAELIPPADRAFHVGAPLGP